MGGLLILIVRDLLFSSFLYVISELVRGLPVRLQEMPKSVQAFFWPIINVLFVLWIVSIVLSFSGNTSLVLPVLAVEFIILNAVPEIIYQKQIYGGLNTIAASVNFIQENWIEWFIPNVAFAAAMLFLFLGGFGVSPLIDRLPFGGVVVPVLMGAFVHCAFVFRGFLFAALDGSSARQRAMKYR